MTSPATDEEFMLEALSEAARAAADGEVPVGAVLVDPDGNVVTRAHNATRAGDATAHAEMLAIRNAASASARGTLEGHTLFVSLEPCAMCAGAILNARLSRLVFAAFDEKAGAVGSVYDLIRDRRLPQRVEVRTGVLEAESAQLLREFFDELR